MNNGILFYILTANGRRNGRISCVNWCRINFPCPSLFIIESNSYYDDEPPRSLNACTNGIVLCMLVFGLWAIFPSKQTLLLSAATYYGEKVITSKNIDKKIQKVSEIIDIQLDKYEKELRDNVNANEQ